MRKGIYKTQTPILYKVLYNMLSIISIVFLCPFTGA